MAISENPQKRRVIVLLKSIGDVSILDLVRLHSLHDSKVLEQTDRKLVLDTYLDALTVSSMFKTWQVSERGQGIYYSRLPDSCFVS